MDTGVMAVANDLRTVVRHIIANRDEIDSINHAMAAYGIDQFVADYDAQIREDVGAAPNPPDELGLTDPSDIAAWQAQYVADALTAYRRRNGWPTPEVLGAAANGLVALLSGVPDELSNILYQAK